MSDPRQWLINLGSTGSATVDGLVSVKGYRRDGQPLEEVAIMEKADDYGATAVFFEAGRDGRPPLAQAFVFVSDGPAHDQGFAGLHRRLWSWGGVPLVYRVTQGLVQLFRCAHRADFELHGEIVFKPYKTLKLAAHIANDPWWDAERIRNGTLWDDPDVCKNLLSGRLAAQKTLIKEFKLLHEDLDKEGILPRPLRRKLLILSLLIAYLEARKVFEADYFDHFRTGAMKFFEVLADGPALVSLLDHLEGRFNGHVFSLSKEDNATLRANRQLARFARLIEGKQEAGGQLTLWQRYSFADLPIELISHIYQLFVSDMAVAVYTPPFLVRLMLGEVLSWERLDRLDRENEIILDPACGSGVFLVEAYKRLVLHWRSRNDWKRPGISVLKKLLTRVHGIDLEEGAVELAAFSLCLALCDALKPAEIRASVRLFPQLKEKSVHSGCFFEARERGKVKEKIGVVVGNPPFSSSLGTPAAERSYARYQEQHGALPDRQLAYLFLHESMEMLANGGVLSLLQQYNFLYNQQSHGFRRKFIERWNIREILDFISVRGLFQKGGADTKVVVVVAEANQPAPERLILHATFRRSGRADAEQGFDIDYYDMHWLPRKLVLSNDGAWRTDLLGGGRVLGFVDRLKKLRTLGQYAEARRWDCGEGFTFGDPAKARPTEHVVGKACVTAGAFHDGRIDLSLARPVPNRPIERPRKPAIYSAPLLMIHKNLDLQFGYLANGYLTYQHEIFGLSAGSQGDSAQLSSVAKWLLSARRPLLAHVAASSVAGFVSRATAILSDDIKALPYPETPDLHLSATEQILVDDIVDYYRDLIRLGEDSAAMKEPGVAALSGFNAIYTQQINAIYKKNKLHALDPQVWPGVICQPFVFGNGKVDWKGTDELKGKLDKLLREQRDSGLTITRIARIYDGPCIYLLKPDRRRYWLRSVALRDADETSADLWEQGF
jgi:hypothetical protein